MADIRMDHTFQACEARVGVLLDPPLPNLKPQRVLKVERDETGNLIHISTDAGITHTFPWDAPLAFPRHTYGEPLTDWRQEEEKGRFPTPLLLRIGDWLQSSQERPTREPYLGMWKQNFQIVRRVYHALSPLDEYIVVTVENGQTYRYKFHEHEIVRFPRVQTKQYTPQFEKSGVYIDTDYEGVEYVFLFHPHGKGRWPAEVPIFERKHEPGRYESRPPKTRRVGDWQGLKYADPDKKKRHNKDPRKWVLDRLEKGGLRVSDEDLDREFPDHP